MADRPGARRSRGDSPLARVYAFHKPRGVVVSTVREGGSPTVFDLLPEPYRAWFAVGRLDKDSTGLLLFSSDARLAQRLMDPGGLAKTYHVTVRGLPREADLEAMRRGGAVFGGVALRPVGVRRLGRAPRGGTRLEVVLHEGRNRQIRRLMAAAGHRVRQLARVGVGPAGLGGLAPGCGRELSRTEVAALLALIPGSTGRPG